MDSLSSRVAGAVFPLVKRGYEPRAVDAFMDALARQVASIEADLAVAKAKAAQLETRLRSTADADTVVQTAFLAAAEAKAKLLHEAEQRGEQIVAAAQARAAAIDAESGGDAPTMPLEDARSRADSIEADAIRLLEDARREAEAIVTEARRTALNAVDEGRDAVVERADEAREELHRIMWLLKTVKQAVSTGLVAAQDAAPEIDLIIDDAAEMAGVQPAPSERLRS